jgi:surface protein
MRAMFFNNKYFNGDISKWDVSKVTDMNSMFYQSEFIQNLSNWKISSATNIEFMFNDNSDGEEESNDNYD